MKRYRLDFEESDGEIESLYLTMDEDHKSAWLDLTNDQAGALGLVRVVHVETNYCIRRWH